jgi:D-glycero-beta-D-manno-heptose-7-phosphate kinase
MINMDVEKLFKSFAQLKVAVVGDVMLDTYWWGNVERISPEAPVPVVTVNKKEKRIGGAGNVALNACALGARVHMISVVGNDEDGAQLIELLTQNKINTNFIVKSKHRITTNKIRIISRNQHMMRLDAEVSNDINETDEKLLIKNFTQYIKINKPQVVILEDYNKGILTTNTIDAIIKLCKKNSIITAVDPKRKNFFAYKAVDIFKPNLKEVKDALNIITEVTDFDRLKNIHLLLHKKLQHQISLITLSEKGVFFQAQKNAQLLSTHVRSIADVSGAGDTVIAVAALVYAVCKDVKLMAEIANIAGGLVCEEVGTVAINYKTLLKECKLLL